MPVSILDTDLLSEFLKGYDPNVVANGARYLGEHGRFTITALTVHEVLFGLELKSASGQRERFETWLANHNVVTPTIADFRTAALMRAATRKRGAPVELPDCLIAAIAARLDAPLITGNTRDFEAIQSVGVRLTLSNWRVA